MNYRVCEICGNPLTPTGIVCPFCNAIQSEQNKATKKERFREVNLEYGMPTAEEGLSLMNTELKSAKSGGIKLLRFIHGYGSTGIGGKIRAVIRRDLAKKLSSGKVLSVLHGENYREGSLAARSLRISHPRLDRDVLHDTGNHGITFVEL
jgi:hypothetical protein